MIRTFQTEMVITSIMVDMAQVKSVKKQRIKLVKLFQVKKTGSMERHILMKLKKE